jgi:hypothetical protein
MITRNHAEQVGEYRREAKRSHYAARRDAERAASSYRTARRVEQHASWLTGRPDLAEPGYTPADLAAQARAWVGIADPFLRSSFRATDRARFYTDLGRRYDGMAQRAATV